jgi:hypothetical protein
MTLIEFIAPISDAGRREKCLAILYYRNKYSGKVSLTVEQIREGLAQTRVPKWQVINVSDVLGKSGRFVESASMRGAQRLWRLTQSGEEHVRHVLGLPPGETDTQNDVATLTRVAATITDSTAREYVEEAITCLRAGALRAAIVFLWTGAVRTLQERALTADRPAVSAAVKTHDPKARGLDKIDDFAYVKDAITIRALQDVGVIDKGEKGTLEEALNLRNRCGHPTDYKPGTKKASSFVEDIIGIVFA